MGDRKYTTVLVDDSADIRSLVRMRLEATGRFTVIAEGADGMEAIDLARIHRPDVMVLDVSMPRMDGLDALSDVRKASPQTVVTMFTGFDSPELTADAQRRGAAAVLNKGTEIRAISDKLLGLLGDAGKNAVEAPEPSPAEQVQLAEHVERFREIFDAASIGMAMLTLSGRIARANEAAELLLRDGKDEAVVGREYAEFVDEPSREAVRHAVRLAAAGEPLQQLEHYMPASERVVWMSLGSVTDTQGEPLYLYTQVQDLTQQRAAEHKLRETEDRLRLLVETVIDYAIFVLDERGHVKTWSPGAQRIKGWSEQEVVGRHFRVFYTEEARAAGHPEHELQMALRDGRYEEAGWRVRKDGSRFWANVIITPLYERGELIGFGKVTRDLSNRSPITLADRDDDDLPGGGSGDSLGDGPSAASGTLLRLPTRDHRERAERVG